jgi:hypothetical protein
MYWYVLVRTYLSTRLGFFEQNSTYQSVLKYIISYHYVRVCTALYHPVQGSTRQYKVVPVRYKTVQGGTQRYQIGTRRYQKRYLASTRQYKAVQGGTRKVQGGTRAIPSSTKLVRSSTDRYILLCSNFFNSKPGFPAGFPAAMLPGWKL